MVVLQLPALPPAPRIGLDERSSTGRLPSRPWTVQHDRRGALAPPLVISILVRLIGGGGGTQLSPVQMQKWIKAATMQV